MNHTDGLCSSTELPFHHISRTDHCIYLYIYVTLDWKKSALNSSISKKKEKKKSNTCAVPDFWAFSEGLRLQTLLAAPLLGICRGQTYWYCFYVQASWESNWCLIFWHIFWVEVGLYSFHAPTNKLLMNFEWQRKNSCKNRHTHPINYTIVASTQKALRLLTRFQAQRFPVTTAWTRKKMKLQHYKWIINKETSILYLRAINMPQPGCSVGRGQHCGRGDAQINNVTGGDWQSMLPVTLIDDHWKPGTRLNGVKGLGFGVWRGFHCVPL